MHRTTTACSSPPHPPFCLLARAERQPQLHGHLHVHQGQLGQGTAQQLSKDLVVGWGGGEGSTMFTRELGKDLAGG